MSEQIGLKDIQCGERDWRQSLLKLIGGKKVKDIEGYLSDEFGDVTFKLCEIFFEDGTSVGVEGEHDFPYITSYPRDNQPNLNDETLERLFGEMYPEDEEEED